LFEQPSDIMVAYANHAHNDLLEVWLETGVAGLILIGAFLIWFSRRAFLAWRGASSPEAGDVDRGLVRAASIVIALLLAHSLVEYPLRSTALMAIAAFSCGLLIPPRPSSDVIQREPLAARYERRHEVSLSPAHEISQAEPTGLAPAEQEDVPRLPRPRERWGQSIEWPEAWRQSQTPPKPTDGSDKKKG
jgi:hypothetical protein